MAQHRTKQDKIATQMRREEKYQYNLQELDSGSSTPRVISTTGDLKLSGSKSKLVGFLNLKHLQTDLIRSLISTVVICTVLFVIWYLMK